MEQSRVIKYQEAKLTDITLEHDVLGVNRILAEKRSKVEAQLDEANVSKS